MLSDESITSSLMWLKMDIYVVEKWCEVYWFDRDPLLSVKRYCPALYFYSSYSEPEEDSSPSDQQSTV